VNEEGPRVLAEQAPWAPAVVGLLRVAEAVLSALCSSLPLEANTTIVPVWHREEVGVVQRADQGAPRSFVLPVPARIVPAEAITRLASGLGQEDKHTTLELLHIADETCNYSSY
jgi:hypothetical protein